MSHHSRSAMGFDLVADMLQSAQREQVQAPSDRPKPVPVVQHKGMTREERRRRQRKGWNVPAYRNAPLEKEKNDD